MDWVKKGKAGYRLVTWHCVYGQSCEQWWWGAWFKFLVSESRGGKVLGHLCKIYWWTREIMSLESWQCCYLTCYRLQNPNLQKLT